MKTVVRLLLFAVIGIPMLAFAVANRHLIAIGLDPMASQLPEGAPKFPLFVVVFGALLLGVLLGGIAAWLGQGKHRRAARHNRAELERLRNENASGAKPADAR